MKKILGLIAAALLATVAVSAKETLVFSPEALAVQALIKKGAIENASQIALQSKDLTADERTALYEQNKKGAVLPAVLNGVIGFGLGSFIEGDKSGGIQYAIKDGICFSLMALSISRYKYYYNMGTSGDPVAGTGSAFGCIFYIGVTAAVGIVDLCFRVAETIHPFAWTDSYNKTLKSSLDLPENVAFTLIPAIDPVNNEYGVVARVSF